MNKKLTQKIAKAFDDFILATGGNVDPRGASNRDRKALMAFWLSMQEEIGLSDVFSEINLIMQYIIDNRIIGDYPQSQKKFSVYRHRGAELIEVER